MTIFITQGRYTGKALVGMINKAEDRSVAVAALAKAVGGKLLDYYVTFGEYDFLVVIESGRGKNESDTMAALLAASASGGVTDLKTTIAVRPKEAMKAMRGAKRIIKNFSAAGQAE